MSSAGIIHFIYNETIVSRALPSSSVDYNWFTGINVLSPRNYSLVINKINNKQMYINIQRETNYNNKMNSFFFKIIPLNRKNKNEDKQTYTNGNK